MSTQSTEELNLGENKDSGHNVVLISKDEKRFDINSRYASISIVIQTMLDGDHGMEEAALQVSGIILALIIEYMNTNQSM